MKTKNKKRSLILAGGGIKVAFQAGVLQVWLDEAGLEFDHADGASGGHAYVILGLDGIESWIRGHHFAPLVELLDRGVKQVRFDGKMFYAPHRVTTRVYPPQSKMEEHFWGAPLVEPVFNNGLILRYHSVPRVHRENLISRLYEAGGRGETGDPIEASSCITAVSELIWN